MHTSEERAHGCADVRVTRDENTLEVQVSATIPAETLSRYRRETLKDLRRTVEIDGFRKGSAPEEMVIKRVGAEALLRQAAENAVQEELPKVFAAEKLLVIAAPQVSVGVPQEGAPLSFTAKAPLAPHVELADYKKISLKHPESPGPFEATDQEAGDAILHLRRERKRIELIEAGSAPEKAAQEASKADSASLPAIDDAFASSIGFESAEAFTASVRTNIEREKRAQAHDKRRAEIIDAIVESSTIRMPEIVRAWELDEIEAQFSADLARAGTTVDAYLSHIGKTKDTVRDSWKDSAEKRAKTRLALDAIAAKEKIEPSAEDVSREAAHLKLHHPSASEEAVEAFVRRSLRTEMTVRFLEGKDPAVPPTTHQH